MKIRLYTQPNQDPRSIAEQVKTIVESITGQPCIVKVTGDPTRPVRIEVEE